MPVFYRDNMYRKEEDRVFLKLYNGKDWVWQEALLKKTDLDYLRKYWSDVQAKSPVLVKKHGKYFLQFAFEQRVKLTERAAVEQRICAVDLGINTDAVCSIMTADGTVAARKFISFEAEKDRLYHVLNRVRKQQKDSGSDSKVCFGLWCGCDCVRAPGHAGQDTREEPAEAPYVEEAGGTKDHRASGPPGRHADCEGLCMEDKCTGLRWIRTGRKR